MIILSTVGFLVVSAVALWTYQKIMRLLRVNSLFAEHKIIYNFSNMNRVFRSVSMSRGPHPITPLPHAPLPMPKTYTFQGRKTSLEQSFQDSFVTAIVVLKKGNIAYEDYFHDTSQSDLRISWSMAKSFLSALAGALKDHGDLPSLNVIVSDVVPCLKNTAYDGTTLQQVMNMSSGATFNEDYLDVNSDINRMGRVLALGRSMDHFATSLRTRDWDAGTYSKYVSIDTHVIGMVLSALTNRKVEDLLQEHIIAPLGLEAAPYYLIDDRGTAFVLGGLNLTTRDYARFGLMMSQQGRIGDRQVISADWVRESTAQSAPPPDPETAQTPTGKLGYGYQWWRPENAGNGEFFAIGIYGQYLYINSGLETVIAINSTNRQFTEGNGIVAQESIQICREITKSLMTHKV